MMDKKSFLILKAISVKSYNSVGFLLMCIMLVHCIIIKSFATEEDVNPWQNPEKPLFYSSASSTELLAYENVKNTSLSENFPTAADSFPPEWKYEQLPLGSCNLNYQNNPVLTEITNTLITQAKTLELVGRAQKMDLLTKQNLVLVFALGKFFDLITNAIQNYTSYPNSTVYGQLLTLGISAAFVVMYNVYSAYIAPTSFYGHPLLTEYTTPIFWKAWEVKTHNKLSNESFLTICQEAIISIENLPDRRNSIVQFLEKSLENSTRGWIKNLVSLLPKKTQLRY